MTVVMQLHHRDLDSCLLVTPAAPASLINMRDEDRLLLRRDGKTVAWCFQLCVYVFVRVPRLEGPSGRTWQT